MEPDKNISGPEMKGEPDQKEEKKPALSVKATFWIMIVLLVVLVALMVAIALGQEEKTAGIFVLLMFVLVIVNRACWKCPACKKHLGRFGYPKSCPHCGEDLKM